MPEIKQPEQLSLSLEDNRLVPDELTVEKLRRAIDLLRVNVPAPDAVLVARAPQPLGRPGQRMIRDMLQPAMIIIDEFGANAQLEVHVGRMPENP